MGSLLRCNKNTFVFLALIVSYCCHGENEVDALVPPKNPLRSLPVPTGSISSIWSRTTKRNNNNGGNGMTMYFDDISRFSIRWNPLDISGHTQVQQSQPPPVIRHEPSSTPYEQSQQKPSSSSQTSSPMGFPSPSDQKHDALKRLLIGYNAKSASELSQAEVLELVDTWALKSGVVGDYFGDELFQEITGSTYCNATHVVGALAQFWTAIVDVIHHNTDEFKPLHWTTKSSAASPADSRSGEAKGDKVHFVILPNVEELYDYKTMFTFIMAVEFSKSICLHLGNRFSLSLFHPKYKDSPKILSPERHSPFPIAGLQFHQPSKKYGNNFVDAAGRGSSSKTQPKRQRGNTFQKKGNNNDKDEEEEDEALDPIVKGRLFDIDEQRHRLEVLFNSAAVAGSENDVLGTIADYNAALKSSSSPSSVSKKTISTRQTIKSKSKSSLSSSKTSNRKQDASSPSNSDDVPAEGDMVLFEKFLNEHQVRRRNLPKSKVFEISKSWIEKHRFTDPVRKSQRNRALRFVDTVPDDRWTISEHKVPEYIYADLWNTISELYDVGTEAERIHAMKQAEAAASKAEQDSKTKEDDSKNSKKGHFYFVKSFARSFHLEPKSDEKKSVKETRTEPVIVSSMFVTTKFCAYNAQQFKRFAITINASLKRLTNGRMFIEVFHNEYTGQSGFDNSLRRSPFPMIQICFEVAPGQKK